jgi:hypothetical protein
MDGRVLAEALLPALRDAVQQTQQPAAQLVAAPRLELSEEEEAELEARLKGLGYLG